MMSTIVNLHTLTQSRLPTVFRSFQFFLDCIFVHGELEFFYFLQFSESFSWKEVQALMSHLEFFALSEIAKTGKDSLERLFLFLCFMLSISLLHYHRNWLRIFSENWFDDIFHMIMPLCV